MDQDRTRAEEGLSALRISEGDRAEGRAPRSKRLLIVAGCVIIPALVVVLLISGRRVAVGVTEARPAATAGAQAVLNASGYVTPRRKATVAAKITGRVKEMLVDEGMVVSAGQVLARLEDTDARASLAAAEADRKVAEEAIPELEVNLADARRTLARTTDLASSGYTDQQSLDRAKALVDGLEARIQMARGQVAAAAARAAVARREVDNCTVTAPFDGIAVSKDAQPGEMVSPVSAGGGFTRTGISTVVDMSSLEVEVDVNESYIAKVKPGQRVEATLDAYPEWKIPCSVRTVIPTADRQKATVKVRIAFDALDARILPDMGVKVAFLSEGKPGETPLGVLVPRECLVDAGGAKVAFVLKGGRLWMRSVTVGEVFGTEVNLTSGITPGEKVVLKGADTLKDGMRAVEKR